MHEYQVTRAAVKVERVTVTSEHLELQASDRQQRRFSWLSLLAIAVSFVHMAAALALFSHTAWYECGAALAMTGLVDSRPGGWRATSTTPAGASSRAEAGSKPCSGLRW